MNISISTLKDWLKCGQFAYNKHVLHRGPAGMPKELGVGILFHEGMALRPGEKAPEAMVEAYSDDGLPSWQEVGEDARSLWLKHKLWLPINHWVPDPQWTLLQPEMKLTAPISPDGRHALQGTLDRPIIWQGKLWSLQYKTYDGAGDPRWALLTLLDKVKLSFHEVAYQWLMERTIARELKLPVGGTILGACEKLPGYRIVDGKRAEVADQERIDAFTFHHLIRSRNQQDALWGDCWTHLLNACNDMESERPTKNLDYCFAYGGRLRCPFFEVCHGAETLDDPKFVDLKARY